MKSLVKIDPCCQNFYCYNNLGDVLHPYYQNQKNLLIKNKNSLSYVLLPIAMLCGAPDFPANTLTLVVAPPSTLVTVPLFSLK